MEPAWDAPLTPLSFLERSADVWADRPAVVDGERAWTYAEHHERVRRAAGALHGELRVAAGDRVAALLPNVSALLERHSGAPGGGAVLGPPNPRLTGGDYAHILAPSGAGAVFAAPSLRAPLEDALERIEGDRPRVVWVGESPPAGGDYESLLAG